MDELLDAVAEEGDVVVYDGCQHGFVAKVHHINGVSILDLVPLARHLKDRPVESWHASSCIVVEKGTHAP